MVEQELVQVLTPMAVEDRDQLEQIIINGVEAKDIAGANLDGLEKLGLIRWQDYPGRSCVPDEEDFKPRGTWVYMAGPIGDFFKINMQLNANMATTVGL